MENQAEEVPPEVVEMSSRQDTGIAAQVEVRHAEADDVPVLEPHPHMDYDQVVDDHP
jgi:hypothetical protein